MNRRSTESPRIARIVLTVGVIAASVVAIAARAPSQQQQPPSPPVPPASTDTQATVMDVIDSMAAATPAPVAAPAPAPTPARAQGAWPVDAAGRTLINGKPVIGRVFVQRKVDGLEAYDFANVYKGEAIAPDRPVVATKYSVPPVSNSRRQRGIMVQATLWEIDHKRSSVELRHHRPVTPAARLAKP